MVTKFPVNFKVAFNRPTKNPVIGLHHNNGELIASFKNRKFDLLYAFDGPFASYASRHYFKVDFTFHLRSVNTERFSC